MDNTLAHRVRSEAKSVRRLAGSLENYLRRNLAFRRHPSELKPLFGFYASAFMALRKYGLLSIIDIDKKDDLYARNLLKELYTVKRILQLLYDKMHAAVQAETLNTPYPILLYLNKLCRSMPAIKAQDVTVGFLAAQPMMYYHYPMEKAIALSDLLRLTIDGFPAFPTSLALVGYPYTESANPLLNCALIHELGHFAWAKLPISVQVGKTIGGLSVAGIPFDNLFEEDYYLTTCTQALQRWCAEVFADSFAIQHCGPAYCFAFREMANLLPIREHAEDAFTITHPAISYRWHLHAAMLSKTAWWSVLQNQAADEYAWLANYLPERKHTAPFIAMAELVGRVFRIFDKATREVISYCDNEFSEYAGAAIGDFERLGPQVREYLQHGIPPASIVTDGRRLSPMAPTILNAAWFLSLEGMTATLALMGKEGDQEALDVVESRLAGWVSKALEDVSEGDRQEAKA